MSHTGHILYFGFCCVLLDLVYTRSKCIIITQSTRVLLFVQSLEMCCKVLLFCKYSQFFSYFLCTMYKYIFVSVYMFLLTDGLRYLVISVFYVLHIVSWHFLPIVSLVLTWETTLGCFVSLKVLFVLLEMSARVISH